MLGISTLILGTVLSTPLAPYPHGLSPAATPYAPVEASAEAEHLRDPFAPENTGSTQPAIRRRTDLVDPFTAAAATGGNRKALARPSASLATPFAHRDRKHRIPTPSASLPDPFA
jgi:hypothetical protein